MVEESKKEAAFVGCVLVGSGAIGFTDEYSDIDIVIVVDDAEDFHGISDAWKNHLHEHLPVLAYGVSPRAEKIILHNFYLANYLELNICVMPLDVLSAFKAQFKVIWDRTCRMQAIMEKTWDERRSVDPLIEYFKTAKAGIWHYINHGFIALERGKAWQGLSDIDEIRRQIIHLHAYRNGLDPKRNRDVDAMEESYKNRLVALLVDSTSIDALKQKLNLAAHMFFEEARDISRERGLDHDLEEVEAAMLNLVNQDDR